jgi:hypothetical protein
MYNSIFDNYFPSSYIKKHEQNNWNYWKKGYELDRYEIYKLDKEYYKMVIPLQYDSVKVSYRSMNDLLSHLDTIKNRL